MIGAGAGARNVIQTCKEGDRLQNESGQEARNSPEVIEERAAVTAEEDAVSHDVEVEERRNDRENADYQCGPVGRSCARKAMNKPVERLGQAGNAQHHDQISQQAAAESESFLLHTRVGARRQGDVGNLNQNNGKVLAKPAMGHGQGVHR